MAGGADDYDAVNVAQLKELSSKLTQEATNSKLSSGKILLLTQQLMIMELRQILLI